MPGRVITVASGKGGVGKTTTAVNLAVALWREGNAVAVVDADLGMANLAAVLGIDPPDTLHDVLAGEATVQDVVVEARDGDLVVVPGERDLTGFAEADPGELEAVLADLASGRDFVVVDTGAGLSYEDVLPLGLADDVLLVTTPDPSAVGDTCKTLELSGLLDGHVSGVVVTRAGDDTDADAVAEAVGAPLLGVIPEDPAVTESTAGGGPLESVAPDAPATVAYRELAARIARDSATGADGAGAPGPPADEVGEPPEAATEHEGAAGSPQGEGGTSTTAGAGDETPPDAPVPGPDEGAEADDVDDGGDTTGAEADDVDDGGDTTGAEADDVDDEGGSTDAEAAVDDGDDTTDAGDDEPETAGAGDRPGAAGAEDGGEDTGEDGTGDEEPGRPDGDGGADEEAASDGEDADEAGGRGGLLGWFGRPFR